VESLIPDYQQHKHLHKVERALENVPDESQDRAHLLVFSAHDEATLKCNLSAFSSIGGKADLIDLAYTLSTHRSKLSCRAFAVCRKPSYEADLAICQDNIITKKESGATAFAFAGKQLFSTLKTTTHANTPTGQGSQWPRMGASLIQLYPSYRQTIQELDSYLASLSDPPCWTIEGELLVNHARKIVLIFYFTVSLLEPPSISRDNEAEFSQPLCTAIQIGLVQLLRRWVLCP
jgi:acyl transferase domain-containing protein